MRFTEGFQLKNDIYSADITLQDKRGEGGIDGGRITRLIAKPIDKEKTVLSYDKKWSKKPRSKKVQALLDLIVYLYN